MPAASVKLTVYAIGPARLVAPNPPVNEYPVLDPPVHDLTNVLLTNNWILLSNSDPTNDRVNVPPDPTTPEPLAPLIRSASHVSDGVVLSMVNGRAPESRSTPLALRIRSWYPVHRPVYAPV